MPVARKHRGGSRYEKTLVAYFSASGVTSGVAKNLAAAANAALYEIRPAKPYTREDLNWSNKESRSSLEAADPASRPKLADNDAAIAAYYTIFLGFPIWWYVAPHIVNSFLESYDFSGKTIVIFATSGGSRFGNTLAELKKSCPASVRWLEWDILNRQPSTEQLRTRLAELNL